MPRKMGKERVRCFVPEGSQKRKATRVRSLRQRWIVNSVVPIFVLLALIGANMIREALSRDEDRADDDLSVKAMLVLAVATSIDALAVGITFAFLEVNLLWAVLFIGAITFTLSAVGVKVGNVFGEKYKSRAELAGGAILVLLGVKILLEHLNLLPF